MIYYKQCVLINDNRAQVAYIPEQFAVVGEILKIRGENGWVVHSVGSRKSHDEILKLERLWTKTRKHSDI